MNRVVVGGTAKMLVIGSTCLEGSSYIDFRDMQVSELVGRKHSSAVRQIRRHSILSSGVDLSDLNLQNMA